MKACEEGGDMNRWIDNAFKKLMSKIIKIDSSVFGRQHGAMAAQHRQVFTAGAAVLWCVCMCVFVCTYVYTCGNTQRYTCPLWGESSDVKYHHGGGTTKI